MPARRKRLLRGCLLLLVVALVAAVFVYGPVVRDFWKHGLIQSALSKPEERKYTASETSNLRAIYTAMMLYHDSEQQFPAANGWMDAIEPRLRTTDMPQAEAEKKLIRPDLEGQTGKFGYAMNDAAAGKYIDDLKDKKMPLVYSSTATVRNAHGDPAKGRKAGGLAISVDGTIFK